MAPPFSSGAPPCLPRGPSVLIRVSPMAQASRSRHATARRLEPSALSWAEGGRHTPAAHPLRAPAAHTRCAAHTRPAGQSERSRECLPIARGRLVRVSGCAVPVFLKNAGLRATSPPSVRRVRDAPSFALVPRPSTPPATLRSRFDHASNTRAHWARCCDRDELNLPLQPTSLQRSMHSSTHHE